MPALETQGQTWPLQNSESGGGNRLVKVTQIQMGTGDVTEAGAHGDQERGPEKTMFELRAEGSLEAN